MITQASIAAMREGGRRGGAEMRAQRLAGLEFAKAWRERGGAQERWREYVHGYAPASETAA